MLLERGDHHDMNNTNHSSNNFDTEQLLRTQQFLAARAAQRSGLNVMNNMTSYPIAPAAVDQSAFLPNRFQQRIPYFHPNGLEINPGGNTIDSQQFGILQAMMMQNSLKRQYPDNIPVTFANTQEQLPALDDTANLAPPSAEDLDDDLPQQAQGLDEIKPSAGRKRGSSRAPKGEKPKRKDTKWLKSYEELKEYRVENGDCIVPRGYPLNPRLASWVAEQRKQYKLLKDGKPSSITEERVRLLSELDFAWNAQEAAYERHLEDLKKYKVEFCDTLVPLNHPKYPKLGLWVKEQRRHYALLKQGKPSHMTEERARALDELGFCWDTHEEIWSLRLKELCDYKANFGDCVVPTNFSANPKLGTWVHHQRRQYKKYKEGKPCHITAERIRALDNLGFVWYPRDKASVKRDPLADDNSSVNSDSDSSEAAEISSFDLRPSKRHRRR